MSKKVENRDGNTWRQWWWSKGMRKNGGNGDGNSSGHGGKKEKEGNEEELVRDSSMAVALWEEKGGEWGWW